MNSKYLILLLVFAQSSIKPQDSTSKTTKKVFPIKGRGQLSITTNCTEKISVKEDAHCSSCTVSITKKGSAKHYSNLATSFKGDSSEVSVEVKSTSKDTYATSVINAVVPKGTIVKCICKGKTILQGAINEAYIETTSEPVTIKGISGALDIKTESGDITVVDSRGHIIAETSSGYISIENPSETLAVSSSSGDISIKYPNKDVNIATKSGHISLELVALKAAQMVRAKTLSGDVSCALPKNETPSIIVHQTSGKTKSDDFHYKRRKNNSWFGAPTPPCKDKKKALIYINSITGNVTFNIYEGVTCCQ